MYIVDNSVFGRNRLTTFINSMIIICSNFKSIHNGRKKQHIIMFPGSKIDLLQPLGQKGRLGPICPISKPELAVLFALGRGIHVAHFLKFTSCVTPADLLVVSNAAEPLSSTYP